ncbi:hypothetical protein ACO2Q3_26240 [Caulobacter sp. KR2-114]|uniref:hypothetical protein n=1 Tax=Caulobacter sp. KR2-114 TaxID=3400912 RepID=UPI003C11B20D
MSVTSKLTLALVLGAAAGAAHAQDAPPASPPNLSLYSGACLHPGLGGSSNASESALGALLLGQVAPALIDKAFDWVGAKLTALGADKKTVLSGRLAVEPQFGGRYCIQAVHWKDDGQHLDALVKWKAQYAQAPLIPQDRGVDFFMEFWVRPSQGGDAISYTPTLIYYPALLGGRNGKRDPLLAVNANLAPVGAAGAAATWTLPTQNPDPAMRALLPLPAAVDGVTYRYGPTDLAAVCNASCPGASPWVASPWADAKVTGGGGGGGVGRVVDPHAGGGGQAYAIKPVNVSLQVTEIRSGSEFFAALASLFNTASPAVEAQLRQAISPEARAQAASDQMTAQATALTAYSTSLDGAESTRRAFCAADPTSAYWPSLSAQLRAAQLSANVAAGKAQQPAPYPVPASVGDTRANKAICP